MLLYYVDMFLRYVDMLFYYVDIYLISWCQNFFLLCDSFFTLCAKHHIIIPNFSMTKITKVIADAEHAGWKWPIFILLCIERSRISDLGIYIRYS